MAIPLLAAAGIQAIPALTGLFGNLIGKKRRNQQENFAGDEIRNLADIFKQQLGIDYFDSAEGMGAMKQIDQNASDQADEINSMANMGNLTDEARIAMLGKNMSAKQNAFSGLAQQSELWRQRNQRNYQGALGQLFQAGMARRSLDNQSLNNIVGGMQGAMDGAVNAGVFDSWLGKSMGGAKGGNTSFQGANSDIPASKYLWG